MSKYKNLVYQKIDSDRKRKKVAPVKEPNFHLTHISVNAYLTYKGDSVYMKKNALIRLIKEAKKKWIPPTSPKIDRG